MLISYASLAEKILAFDTGYSSNKRLIFDIFFKEKRSLNFEDVKLRLIVIDSTYSTQMNRRLFGISDLARELLEISEGSDLILRAKLDDYLCNYAENSEVNNVLIRPYGVKKNGGHSGSATSLISKYFYFVLGFKFPIYDSLIKDSLPVINKKFNVINGLKFGTRGNSVILPFLTPVKNRISVV